jgi:hypothetical protein
MRYTKAHKRLREHSVCLILGDCASARLLAVELLLLKGIPSVICDRCRSLSSLFLPTATFYRLCHTNDHLLLTEQLCDIADSGEDNLRLLVCATDEYRNIIKENSSRLETRYILTDRRSIFTDLAPFGI